MTRAIPIAPRALCGPAVAALLLLGGAPAGAQIDSAQVPYWASINVDIARMRKGPSTDMPATWEYRRKGLPVQVVARYENWRKVVDPAGDSGWMNARLLSRTRTAIVTGDAARPMRSSPAADAKVAYRAEPGVVGRISDCKPQWCQFDVRGQRGWIDTAHIWGD